MFQSDEHGHQAGFDFERNDVASKFNPIGKLAGAALETVRHPRSTAGKVVGHAKSAVALGKVVAESAVGATGSAAHRRRHEQQGPEESGALATHLRPVPNVNEPAHTVAGSPSPVARQAPPPGATETTPRADVTGTADSGVGSGPVATQPPAANDPRAQEAPSARKAAANKAPAKKATEAAPGDRPVKKATSKKATSKKAAKKASTTQKTAATPADVAKNVGRPPARKTTPTKPSDTLPPRQSTGAATTGEDATEGGPAKKSTAKRTSAKKTPAKKASTTKAPTKKSAAKKSAAKKSTAKKAPAKKAAKRTPRRTAEQVASDQGDDVMTPVGTPAADRGSNPDTTDHDLNQPGTEPIVEKSTANQVASRSDQLRKAAERNPER